MAKNQYTHPTPGVPRSRKKIYARLQPNKSKNPIIAKKR